MAVHLRMQRMGAKKRPYYRIVAADSRRARNGRFLEILGTYNPIVKPAKVNIFEDKIKQWLDDGAVPSDTVRTLLSQVGFNEKYTMAGRGKDVSSMTIRTAIKEGKKKTRRMKKATVAPEAAQAAAPEAPAE